MESVTVTWTLDGGVQSATFLAAKSRVTLPPKLDVSSWFRGRLVGTCVAELTPTLPACSKLVHHLFQGSSFLPCPPIAGVLSGWPPGWQLVASPDATAIWLICPSDVVGVHASPDSEAVSVGTSQATVTTHADLPQDPHERKKALFPELTPSVREKLQLDDAVIHSTSPKWMADAICEHVLTLVGPAAVVSDGVACVGGDSIRFASRFARVNAIEGDQHRAMKAYNNLKLCGLDTKAYVYHNDLMKLGPCLEHDVVFLGPPSDTYIPTGTGHVSIQVGSNPLIEVCRKLSFGSRRTKYIVLKVPTHFNTVEFSASVPVRLPGCRCETTEVGRPVKALLLTIKLPN